MIDISQKGRGFKPDRLDLRDYRIDVHLKTFGAVTYPSDNFSIKQIADLTPIKDQGKAGECGATSFSKYGQIVTHVRGTDNVDKELSSRYIYSHTHQEPDGSSARDIINFVKGSGMALESDITSSIPGQIVTEQFSQEIQLLTPQQQATAMQQWIGSSLTYVSADVEQVKQAIYLGNGAVIALWGNNACWQTGTIEVPASIKLCTWGHFVLLTGYHTDTQGKLWFDFVNSWGTEWGFNGYGMLPAEYLTSGLGQSEWTLLEEPAEQYSIWTRQIFILKNLIELLTRLAKLK